VANSSAKKLRSTAAVGLFRGEVAFLRSRFPLRKIHVTWSKQPHLNNKHMDNFLKTSWHTSPTCSLLPANADWLTGMSIVWIHIKPLTVNTAKNLLASCGRQLITCECHSPYIFRLFHQRYSAHSFAFVLDSSSQQIVILTHLPQPRLLVEKGFRDQRGICPHPHSPRNQTIHSSRHLLSPSQNITAVNLVFLLPII
jgi:hypothetical protein